MPMRIHPLTAGCLILLCAAALTGCAQSRQLVQNPFTRAARHRSLQYDLAQVAEKEGHLRQAADQYRDLMKQKPKDARYQHRLGVVQLRLGEAEEGIALLEQARELNPDDPALLNDLGFAYLESGELEQAEEQFKAALSITPNDPRTINNLGLCAGFAGRMDEAHHYFRRVGTEAQAQANLAYVLAQRGEIPRAIERYNRALSLNPDLKPAAEALVQLASVTHELEESDIHVAHGTASEQPAVRQASSTAEEFDLPPSPETPQRSAGLQPTIGLSAP